MAKSSNTLVFSFAESLKKLQKDLETLEPRLVTEANQAIEDLATAAYSKIVSKAQSELNSTRPDYLKGLSFEKLGEGSYLISLDGNWPNKLESGFASYNLTDVLLRSQKIVQVGRRTGLPWVQQSKEDGHKFAFVPLDRQPFSKAPKNADMAAAIREMQGTNRNTGRRQKITKIFKDALGNPIEGLAAIGRSDNPHLDGLVKYQRAYLNEKTGKSTIQSVYINYRMISEDGKPWINRGFSGIHAFDDAEKYIEEQIEEIAKLFLGDT